MLLADRTQPPLGISAATEGVPKTTPLAVCPVRDGAGNELTALSKTNGTFDAQALAIQSTGQRNNVLAWVFIGAGSAIAATGLVTLIINLSQQPVQVSFAPTASGVSACGSF